MLPFWIELSPQDFVHVTAVLGTALVIFVLNLIGTATRT